eukprot:1150075-Rhodomonas_salina.4
MQTSGTRFGLVWVLTSLVCVRLQTSWVDRIIGGDINLQGTEVSVTKDFAVRPLSASAFPCDLFMITSPILSS